MCLFRNNPYEENYGDEDDDLFDGVVLNEVGEILLAEPDTSEDESEVEIQRFPFVPAPGTSQQPVETPASPVNIEDREPTSAVRQDMAVDRPEEENEESTSDSSSDSSSYDEDTEDEEDPLVKAMKMAHHRTRQHPPEIKFRNCVNDVSFHPGEDVVAVASIVGDVFIYKYSLEECELVKTLECHSRSCRGVEYSKEGDWMVTCGTDKSVIVTDTETGKFKQFYDNAHEESPYSLYVINDNLFSSGDEGGVLKVWDVRNKTAVMSFKVGDDSISCMITNSAEKHLVCSATDCITAYDLPAKKMFVQSEAYNTELTAMSLLKQETKLLVGSMTGKMYLYNWGEFGYHSDVLKGPKHSINAMLPITETIVATGNGDSNLRACSVFPLKQLGVVGQHTMSVEALDISHDGQWLGSVGFDETLRFWDIGYFEDMAVKATKSRQNDLKNNLPSSRTRNPGEFFADLS